MLRADIIDGRGLSPAERQALTREAQAGRIKRLAPGFYTGNLKLSPEEVVKRNALHLAAAIQPGGVLTGRSGFELIPSNGRDGLHLFLAGGSVGSTILPGLTIHRMGGAGPLEADIPYLGLYIPSFARRCLENLVRGRVRKAGAGVARTLGRDGVETRVDAFCAQHGEIRLNDERDLARRIAPQLGLEAQFQEFDALVATILGTRNAPLSTSVARARAAGNPYDPDAIARIGKLADCLAAIPMGSVLEPPSQGESRTAACFIEAYFSNYIEGTRFPIEVAKDIVFNGIVPDNRPQDGHDVLATFQQLADLEVGVPLEEPGQRLPPIDYASFRSEIVARHADLMAARPEVSPGKFKSLPNVAGSTSFVVPELVEGTLRAAVERLSDVHDPFSRALLIHFLLVEIHPFADGNGRLSRIMMTRALLASGLSRIVVPTVHREDYVDTLRLLSRNDIPDAFVRCMMRLQALAATAHATTLARTIDIWATTNAFLEPREARLCPVDLDAQIEWRGGVPLTSRMNRELDEEAGTPGIRLLAPGIAQD